MLQSLRFQLVKAHINENAEESTEMLSIHDKNYGML